MNSKAFIYQSLTWKMSVYITTFMVNVFMARLLGPETSGGLFFMLNNLAFFLLVGSLSMESGVVFHISKSKSIAAGIPLFLMLWSLAVTALVVFSFHWFFSAAINLSRTSLSILCTCYTLGILLNTYFSSLCFSLDNYRAPSMISSFTSMLLLVFMPWQPQWLGFVNESVFILLFGASFLLQGLFTAFYFFYHYRANIHSSPFRFKEVMPILRFSVTALWANIAFFLLYRVDYWIVERYCSSADLGIYIQVSKVVQACLLIPSLLHGVLFQQWSKKDEQVAIADIRKVITTLIFLYLFMFFVFVALGRFLITMVWGEVYGKMYGALLLLFPGLFCLSIAYVFSAVMSATGRLKFNLIISWVVFFIILALDFMFIPVSGINGAALASSIGYFAMLLLYIAVVVKKLGFPFRRLFN